MDVTLHNTYISVSILTKMFTDDTHKNVHITTGDGSMILTHSAVLAALSNKFHPLFASNSYSVFKLNTPGVTCKQWQVILELVYTGRVTLPRGIDVERLVDVCQYLEMPEMVEFLKEQCEDREDSSDRGSGENESSVDDSTHGQTVVSCTLDAEGRLIQHQGSTSQTGMDEAKAQHQSEDVIVLDEDSHDSNNNQSADKRTPKATNSTLPFIKTEAGVHQYNLSRKLVGQSKKTTTHYFMRLTCEECEHVSGNVHTAAQHLLAAHGMCKSYRCRVCDKAFKTYAALCAHAKMRCFASKKPSASKMRPKRSQRLQDMNKSSACMDKRCDICGYVSGTYRAAASHIKNVHKRRDCYICRLCGFAYRRLNSLYYHFVQCRRNDLAELSPRKTPETHTGRKCGGTEKSFTCKKCGSDFKFNSSLQLHMRKGCTVRNVTRSRGVAQTSQKDTDDKKLQDTIMDTKCNSCGKVSDSIESAAKHYRWRHGRKKCFICIKCGVGYQRCHALKVHFNSKCSKKSEKKGTENATSSSPNMSQVAKTTHHANLIYDTMDKKCNICDIVSKNIESAAKHLREVHNLKKCYVCKKCETCFSSRWPLTCHFKKCTGKKKSGFQRSSSYGRQVQNSGSEAMDKQCIKCDKISDNVEEASKHLRSAHRIKNCYICKRCSKAFPLRTSLYNHCKYKCSRSGKVEKAPKRRRKLTTMDQTCKLCGVKSSTNNEAANHLKSVHGVEKCFVCKICGEGHENRNSLYMHFVKTCAGKKQPRRGQIQKTRESPQGKVQKIKSAMIRELQMDAKRKALEMVTNSVENTQDQSQTEHSFHISQASEPENSVESCQPDTTFHSSQKQEVQPNTFPLETMQYNTADTNQPSLLSQELQLFGTLASFQPQKVQMQGHGCDISTQAATQINQSWQTIDSFQVPAQPHMEPNTSMAAQSIGTAESEAQFRQTLDSFQEVPAQTPIQPHTSSAAQGIGTSEPEGKLQMQVDMAPGIKLQEQTDMQSLQPSKVSLLPHMITTVQSLRPELTIQTQIHDCVNSVESDQDMVEIKDEIFISDSEPEKELESGHHYQVPIQTQAETLDSIEPESTTHMQIQCDSVHSVQKPEADVIEIKEEIIISDSEQEKEENGKAGEECIDLVDDGEDDTVDFYIEQNWEQC